MAEKISKYAKNAVGLARALGMEMSPRKRKKSIAQLSDWMKDPAFPAKARHGWVVTEVKEWHLKVEGRRARVEGGTAELPAGAGPKEGADLFLNLTTEEKIAARKAMLQKNLRIYLGLETSMFPLQKYKIDELRQEGMIPTIPKTDEDGESRGEGRGAKVEGPEPRVEGQTGGLPDAESQKVMAAHLARHFTGRIKIDISEQQVSNWKSGVNLPQGARLPPTKVGNRLPTQAWADWITQWILPVYGVTPGEQKEFGGVDIFQLAQRAEAQRKIDDGRKASVEAEDVVRRLSDKWIETETAANVAAGAMRTLAEFWKGAIERTVPEEFQAQCVAMGLAPDVVAKLKEWMAVRLRKFTDQVESRAAAENTKYKRALAGIKAKI